MNSRIQLRDDCVPRALDLLGGTGARGGAEPPGDADTRAIAARLRKVMVPAGRTVGLRDADREAEVLAADLVDRARAAMTKIDGGARLGSLTDSDALAMEAVIMVRGRPALRVEGHSIEPIDPVQHPGSDFWRNWINDHEDDLTAVAAATGALRVRSANGNGVWVQGSVWLIDDTLAITNRHVLMPPGDEAILRRTPGKPNAAELNPDFEISIDFAFDNGPARATRYAITGAPFVAEDRDPVDVAVLRVVPLSGNDEVPEPLAVARREFTAKAIYVVGHPGRLTYVPEATAAVFGTPDERKRLSPGELMVPDPNRPLELLHDASTIGGYSGGCVLGFQSREVVGLHYFGAAARANRAFTAPALRAHPVGAFFG